jgi:ribosomal protein L7/L12
VGLSGVIELVLVSLVLVLLVVVIIQSERLSGLRDRIARVVRAVLPQMSGEPSGLAPEVEQEVRRLVDSGQKIVAIKLVRERTGLGLKEAKGLVDRFAG